MTRAQALAAYNAEYSRLSALADAAVAGCAYHKRKVIPCPTLRVCMVEIERYDWQWAQAVCYRPMPTLRPRYFTKTIRVLTDNALSTTPNINDIRLRHQTDNCSREVA